MEYRARYETAASCAGVIASGWNGSRMVEVAMIASAATRHRPRPRSPRTRRGHLYPPKVDPGLGWSQPGYVAPKQGQAKEPEAAKWAHFKTM